MSAAKLLLVEDDPALSELLEYRFQNEGYNVRCTGDGDEALVLASEEVPDLIILDLMLPSMDGYELCRAFRESDRTRHIPIILVTASKESDVIKRGLDAGANDFVTKPVDWQFLADRVAFVLKQSRERETVGRQVEELAEVEAEVAAVASEKGALEQRVAELEQAEARAAQEIL